MNSYNVIIEPIAVQDLFDIFDYVAVTLHEPATAAKLYSNIKMQISTLTEMPKRNKVLEYERYASIGLRSLIIKNYSAYYVVNDNDNTVHIVRVLYNRREWQNIIL